MEVIYRCSDQDYDSGHTYLLNWGFILTKPDVTVERQTKFYFVTLSLDEVCDTMS